MVRLRTPLPHLVIASLAVVSLAACSGTNPFNPLTPGQEDFVTLEQGGDQFASREESAGSADGAGTGAGTNAPAGAPSGRTGTVEEADIYRVDANRLFYLNTYRGFVIYDLADPEHPAQLGRLPVHGYPIEMYVEGNTVYALLRDALYLTREATGLKVTRRNVSQLVAIDVSDLSHPRLIKSLDIVGQLREGVSRKIDDTIYVVSYVPQYYYWPGASSGQSPTEQAWVYSFSIADPANLVKVDELQIFEGGGGATSTTTSSSGRYFMGVAISATANTLHVVENWSVWGSTWDANPYRGCGTYQYFSQATVSVVDISDPAGAIQLHTRFSTYGSLTDQFKQTYVYDEATRKGYYLGIFARQEWSSSNCSGTSFIQNTLEAWDVTDGAHPTKVDSLSFGKPDETVRGSTFDLTRKVAFAITARQIDPLYALSFEDPANLKVLSAIDGLSGDMTVFRLIEGGKYLIGIGRDNSDACLGFGTPTTGWSTNIAVSLIDVKELAAIRLVQRKCVTVQNADWVWSQLSWDLDQAHKMIGMASDARANVITVPVNYYSRADTDDGWYWYRPESAVGLMSYDVSADDPKKPPSAQAVLKNWGTVIHSGGQVTRSILFTHQSGAVARRMMVNLSDTHVSVVDIDDLAHPVTRSVIEVAPYHARLYRFGDYVVDEVQLGVSSWWQPGASEFRVKRAAPGLDDAAPVATFTVGRVDRVVQWKNLLLLFRPVGDPSTQDWRYRVTKTEVVAFDLGDPTHPTRRGSLELDVNLGQSWGYWCGAEAWGYWPGWYGASGLTTSAEGVGALVTRSDGAGWGQTLVFVNTTDADALKATTKELLWNRYDTTWVRPAVEYLGILSGGEGSKGVVLNTRRAVGTVVQSGASFTQYRYYAEHYDSGLVNDWSVNTPGAPMRVFEAGDTTRLLSLDARYQSRTSGDATLWYPEQRLNLLTRRGNVARLSDSLLLGELALGDLVGDAQRLFVNLQRGWWGGVAVSADVAGGARVGGAPEDTLSTLKVLDLSQDRLTQRFSGPLGVAYAQLMGLSGDRLFVSLPGDGVLVVDVSSLDAPVGVNFLRTLGWATHLAVSGSMAFVASGNFGVFELDLSAPATIASN
jgi:hypothetical protein